MAFELGRQYELTVKEVTGGKKNQYTLQVYEAKDKKHSFSIPVDSDQLKMPVNALKHKKVVADYVEIDGKARLRLAKEFFKDSEPAASQTAKETPLAAQEADKPPAELSAGEETAVSAMTSPETTSAASDCVETAVTPAEAKAVVESSSEAVAAPKSDATTENAAEVPLYETGKEYQLSVLFVNQAGDYLNVSAGNNHIVQVPVQGELLEPLGKLKDRRATFICNGYDEEKHPLFSLAPQYFKGDTVVKSMEGLAVEFKQSIVFDPDTHQASTEQTRQIAKEVAAFMNTRGGKLYLGVDNSGRLTGINRDLAHLDEAPIMLHGEVKDSYSYKQDQDGFDLKLHNIIRFYLGALTNELLEDTEFITEPGSGLTYAILTVKPSASNVIYLGNEIPCRHGSSSVFLQGKDRDEFVIRRAMGKVVTHYQESVNAFKGTMESKDAEIAALHNLLADVKNQQTPQSEVIATQKLQSGFIFLNDPAFLQADISPKGVVYKPNTAEQITESATKWNECYVALLKILSDVDPVKFDGLPEAREVQPLRGGSVNFARRGGNVHLKNASEYLGRHNDIRANISAISRNSFVVEKALVRRVIDYFGIDLADLAVLV